MDKAELNHAVASFLAWERTSRDTVDFKKIYADLAGDVLAGLVISQIIYWHLPDKYGQTKLRVERNGELWIAKARSEWWDEIRIGPRQFDRAIEILEQLGLIVTSLHRFNGKPTKHIRILWDAVLPKLNELVLHPLKNPYLIDEPLVDNGFVINDQLVTDSLSIDNESVKSLTETTTETQNTNTYANIADANSRGQIENDKNSVAQENKNDDDTTKPSSIATPLPLVTPEPEDKPDSVHTESAEPSVPPAAPKTWGVGDKVRYTTRGGWGGGTDVHCIAQVLKVNKTKITVVVYNQKTASPQELSVSPSHLTARETDYACDAQIAAYIAKKNEPKNKLPPTYGDLFVAYRDLIYRGDANSPKTTQMRAGKDAKLLLESYPDTDAAELKDFVSEWKVRKSGADVPRGTKLVDWYVVYRKEWKKTKTSSEQIVYTPVPIDMTVSGSEAL